MRNTFYPLILALWLCSCGQHEPAVDRVQTQFSESSGLTVTDSSGQSQLLIPDSLGARAVVSPSEQWIAVEDMQLSDLVVVRLFRYRDGSYREIGLPELRQHWEQLAQQAGIAFEDLVHPRVAIASFGPDESMLLVRFQAEVEAEGASGIESVLAIPLEPFDD